ncbi:MAG: disulfide bond formation protein B [Kofleriaceae bacterium]|nr:disulfide bond formation protein B [Kofleriaceae bacterium]
MTNNVLRSGMVNGSERVDTNWAILFVCWLLVTGASLGSLFFSEVMELPPCTLCWYQRIFMFPLPFVLFMGLFPFDAKAIRYALPLAIAGWAIAAYHLLLHIGIIPESVSPCSQGVSCKTKYLDILGFLSIPLLSLLAFSTAITLLLILRKKLSR